MLFADPAATPRLPAWVLPLLLALYALPGSIGHAPWRGDDVLHIALASEMLAEGHWLTLTLAGERWLATPPLWHWVAALLAQLTAPLLAGHDAMRLSSTLWLVLTLVCLHRAERELHGKEAASAAVLLTLGTLGLLTHAHEAQPQLALTAGLSATLYGLALSRRAPRPGAIIAALGSATAFMASGLPGAVLCLPLWPLAAWSVPGAIRTRLAAGWLLGVALSLIWPLALFFTAPDAAQAWWQEELRHFGPHMANLDRSENLLQLLAWFAWPLWPIAAWAVWRGRGSLSAPPLLLPLASTILALALLALTGDLRQTQALPLLPALALLAATGLPQLRRGAASLFDWFGIMTFTLLGSFVWLAWNALYFSWPRPLARNIERLASDFAEPLSWLATALAAAVSFAWLLLLARSPRLPQRSAVHWAAGMTLLWLLATALWEPWVNHGKRYDFIAAALAQRIPAAERACVLERGAGSVQRAAFFHHAGIKLIDSGEAPPSSACNWLLAYASGRQALDEIPTPWVPVWALERGRGRAHEQLALYWRPAVKPTRPPRRG